MDPLEEKIRKQFALIKTGSKKLLETDFHSIEVKEKIAYIQLSFPTSNYYNIFIILQESCILRICLRLRFSISL